MVPCVEYQHKVILEAVRNHNPEVLIIDQICSHEDALVAAAVVQQGISLVASSPVQNLGQLIRNPALNILLGVETVVSGDVGSRLQWDQQPVVQHRVTSPVFESLI